MTPPGWTLRTLAEATGGAWLSPPDGDAVASGAGIDTRTLGRGEVFFALRGERADGHDMLAAARNAGASAAVVERGVAAPDGLAVLRVASTIDALAAAARAVRASMRARCVGVIGSNGKTTTVRMLESVLGTTFRTHASPRSFNNALGVPLAVLNAPGGTEALVCELGEGTPGALAGYARIARPDAMIITSVGLAHASELGGIAGIRREFADAVAVLAPAGLVVVPPEDALLAGGRRAATFGARDDAILRIRRSWHEDAALRFELDDDSAWDLPVPGEHNALNAAAVIALARSWGVADEHIGVGLATFTPADMRLAVHEAGGRMLIEDCYNANPPSALAALRTLVALGGDRHRVAVLGDMLELGDESPALHAEVGRAAAEVADACVFVGEASEHGFRAARDAGVPCVWCADATEAADRAAGVLEPRSIVLLKASRGVRLERVAAALRHAAPRPAVI